MPFNKRDSGNISLDSRTLFNKLRESGDLNVSILCHGISFDFTAKPKKEGIDLANHSLFLHSNEKIPEILLSGKYTSSIVLDNYLLKGNTVFNRNDDIAFSIKSTELRTEQNTRKNRRLIFFGKDHLFNERQGSDNHYIDTHRVVIGETEGLLHDLSVSGAGIFVKNKEELYDEMLSQVGPEGTISFGYNLDIITQNETIKTRYRILNILNFDNHGYVRIGGIFEDVCKKTEDKIFQIMAQGERKAIQKLRSKSV